MAYDMPSAINPISGFVVGKDQPVKTSTLVYQKCDLAEMSRNDLLLPQTA